MNRTRRRRFATTFTILVAGLLAFGSTLADEVLDEVSAFDIPDQPLDQALLEFSKQADVQIIMAAETTRDLEAVGVQGSQRNRDALERLLADRGLLYTEHSNRTIAVHQVTAADAGGDSDSGNGRTAGAKQKPVMMAQAVAEQSQTSRRTETDSDKDEKERPLEEIIVTGTNIRGIAPESSPVRIFNREDIQLSGAATAQDFIQTLPQNFGGGSNADLPGGHPGDANSISNSGGQGSLGSSVNLRGLGSGSTLVLLNGHRLAPSSGIGDFVDISMIPASAIERVEVLTDGASSIYGSDAVAGVTNFILRDDFEGLETSLRYGVGTQHSSPEEFRGSVTGGLNWNSGHALLSYEYLNRDQIGAQDRSFSQGVLLPNDLTPSQERHSVLGSLSQDLTSDVEVFADLTFSRREAVRNFVNIGGTLFNQKPTSENLNMSAGGTWKATDSWFVDLSGTYSAVDTHNDSFEFPNFPKERTTDSKVWIADVKTSGTVLQLPGGDLKLAMGAHYRTEDFTSIVLLGNFGSDRITGRDVYAFFGEAFIPIVGPDNAIPGIERLELNVSGRYDDYSDFGSTANPKIGVLWAPVETLKLRGSYSTSFNPPPLGRVNVADRGVVAHNVALINALFGLTPGDPSIADVVALNVFGTDKNLDAENSRAFTAGVDFGQQWGRHELAASTTWFDIKFESRIGGSPCPGCVNDISFDAPNVAFNNPDVFPEGTIIFFPTIDQINDVLNSADTVTSAPDVVNPFVGDAFDAEIINFVSVLRNLAEVQVGGLDFNVMYTYDSEIGHLIFGIDGSYLLEFKQRDIVTTPLVEKVNTLFHPVDLKLRGRAGYARDGFAANLFVNYINDYRTDNTANPTPIDSWTTVDLSLSYDTQDRTGNSILNDTVFRLTVLNLFDQDPPSTLSVPTVGIHGYDPTNASALGRFIALEVTKRF